MKKIDIQINQAKIISYSVELRDDAVPEVTSRIGLFAGSKQISSFNMTSGKCYGSGMEFKLPADMIDPIVNISKQLEAILVIECNKQFKQLPAGDIVEAEKVE